MSSYTVTKKKRNMDSIQFQVTLIIISFLSSIFVPFIILYPVQEVLFKPETVWYFEAPFSAYVIFIVAILITSIILLVNVLSDPKTKFMIRMKLGIYLTSLITVVLIIGLCLFNYEYMNPSGIYKNEFFSLEEEFIGWNEIIEAKQIFVKKEGITKDDKYYFTLRDGTVLEMDITSKVKKNKRYIRQFLNENGVTLENVYPTN
jgi:hypothetical protein